MSRLELGFDCMGGRARLLLADQAPGAEPSPRLIAAADEARTLLDEIERRWTRFDPSSDVHELAADPRDEVPVHPHVAMLVEAAAWAGRTSGGLVDATLAEDLVRAGYGGQWDGAGAPLAEALALAPARRAATPHAAARWSELVVDRRAGTVRRPHGVLVDSGGVGKGLAADLVAARLGDLRFVVDLGGDLALGHGGGPAQEVLVEHPLTGAVAHRLRIGCGGVATSGIHRRLWFDAAGRPAHHLLDPATGRPAWTGLLTVTAVGRTALEAEVLAKTALLAGPRRAPGVLAPFGGVLVHEDGRVQPVPALRRVVAQAMARDTAAADRG